MAATKPDTDPGVIPEGERPFEVCDHGRGRFHLQTDPHRAGARTETVIEDLLGNCQRGSVARVTPAKLGTNVFTLCDVHLERFRRLHPQHVAKELQSSSSLDALTADDAFFAMEEVPPTPEAEAIGVEVDAEHYSFGLDQRGRAVYEVDTTDGIEVRHYRPSGLDDSTRYDADTESAGYAVKQVGKNIGWVGFADRVERQLAGGASR